MVAGFAKMLNVDESQVTMQIQGVNHFIFATDVFVDGADTLVGVDEQKRHTNLRGDVQTSRILVSNAPSAALSAPAGVGTVAVRGASALLMSTSLPAAGKKAASTSGSLGR